MNDPVRYYPVWGEEKGGLGRWSGSFREGQGGGVGGPGNTTRSLFDIPHVSSLVYHLFTIEKKALRRVSSSWTKYKYEYILV